MTGIARRMRAQLGAKAHWSFDGINTLCSRGFRDAMENATEAVPMCKSCASAMSRLVKVAEVLAHDENATWFKVDFEGPTHDEAHALGLEINAKLTQVARLEARRSAEARLVAYEIRDEIVAAGFVEQGLSDYPAGAVKAARVAEIVGTKLCPHGIIQGRPCSVCEDIEHEALVMDRTRSIFRWLLDVPVRKVTDWEHVSAWAKDRVPHFAPEQWAAIARCAEDFEAEKRAAS